MVLAPKIATYSALEQVAIFAFPAWISSVILATHPCIRKHLPWQRFACFEAGTLSQGLALPHR